ncbi:MAG: protein-L-isoaspartate(D-aspartate) O-methyltransferase [Bacillota bacterium]
MEENKFAIMRDKMVREQLRGRGFKNEKVMEAFYKVPRHYFTGHALPEQAYGDHPLPIGNGQTISQPYIVALMTDKLNLEGTERVLEIGTGSGYQTVILAELAKEVYTIERIPKLQERAKKVLDSLDYNNIFYKVGDGTKGWPEKAPFRGIIITAASKKVPDELLQQLSVGGKLIAPVGNLNEQKLTVLTRNEDGFEMQSLGGCRFVPLL